MAETGGIGERRVDLAEQLLIIDEHIVAQIAEVAMLRNEVQTERDERLAHGRTVDNRSRRVRVAVAVVAAVLAIIVVNVRWNQQSLHEQRKIDRIIVECMTPDDPAATDPALRVHECYDDAHPTPTGSTPGHP